MHYHSAYGKISQLATILRYMRSTKGELTDVLGEALPVPVTPNPSLPLLTLTIVLFRRC